MSSPGSISQCLRSLQAGDARATQVLWERFYTRLVHFAQQQLRNTPRGAADEEDVVLSAFNRFCAGAQQGRFPKLNDRNDLWDVLALLTERRARDYRRQELRQKRGGGKTSKKIDAECGAGGADDVLGIEVLASHEPTPEFAALMADECGFLLRSLNDDRLRVIAVAKMEGYSNDELAARLECSVSTIERKLKLIRRIWQWRSPHDQDFEPDA
jgi:DNA-directed RNA polymerase specialized sigma24 family protein